MTADRRWTALLVALALTLPVGALLQPWLFPSRSAMPFVPKPVLAPVLLVTIPGLRADHVGHLGDARGLTPNLDELAYFGVTFTEATAAANGDPAAAVSLLTGQPPHRHGVHGAGDGLATGTPTLADLMRRRGRGSVAVVPEAGVGASGLLASFDEVRPLAPGTPARRALAAARQALDERPDSLVWVELTDLAGPLGDEHTPLPAEAPAGFGVGASDLDPLTRGWGTRQAEWVRSRYAAVLAEVDDALGELLEGLRDDMLLGTLCVAVVGSRGLPLVERRDAWIAPGRDLFRSSVHVPIVLSLPGRYVQGRVVQHDVSTLDVAPTLVELVYKEDFEDAWPEACGRSLMPAALRHARPHFRVFSEGPHRPVAADAVSAPSVALRAGDMLAVTPVGRPHDMVIYQLPDERTPWEPRSPTVPETLRDHLERWWSECATR